MFKEDNNEEECLEDKEPKNQEFKLDEELYKRALAIIKKHQKLFDRLKLDD
jgi:hypothetical protein